MKFFRPQLKPLFLILIPSLLWFGAVSSRSLIIHPRCKAQPQDCSRSSVIKIDQLSISFENTLADHYSYLSQNLSGALGLLVPTAYSLSVFIARGLPLAPTLAAITTDWITLAQTMTWNGFVTEISHLLSQRPRPFVYTNPKDRGADPAHYTSFYSGHTSFSAATQIALLLILWKRKAPLPLLFFFLALGETLVFTTAYCRILAGRHFFTDVMTGALAGALVAWVVFTRSQLSNTGKAPLTQKNSDCHTLASGFQEYHE